MPAEHAEHAEHAKNAEHVDVGIRDQSTIDQLDVNGDQRMIDQPGEPEDASDNEEHVDGDDPQCDPPTNG